MATDRSTSALPVLFHIDPRVTVDNLWAAESSYTEADTKAGDPQPQQTTNMSLSAFGDQTAGSAIEARVARAGNIGKAKAAVIWKDQSGAATTYRGWDPPHVITGWEALDWTDTDTNAHPHAVALPNGDVVAVGFFYDAGGGTYHVVAYFYDASSASWGSATTIYTADVAPSYASTAGGSTSTRAFHPTIIRLPSGVLQVYHWIEDTTNAEAQIRMHYSTNNGATWAVGQDFCLAAAVDCGSSPGAGATGYDLGRLRAAHKDGQVILFAELLAHNTTPNARCVFAQYASDDDGMSFGLVESVSDGSLDYWDIDVVVLDGLFYVFWIYDPDTVKFVRLASAYDWLENTTTESFTVTGVGTAIVITTKVVTSGNLAAWVEDDGSLYVTVRDEATGGANFTSSDGGCFIYRSQDGGDTWATMSTGPAGGAGLWWNGSEATAHPRDYCAVVSQGRTFMVHNWDAQAGNEDNSLAVAYLGGWSNLVMPATRLHPGENDRAAFAYTWLPYEKPDDAGWTATGAGTGTLVSPGALQIATSTSSLYYNGPVTPGTSVEGYIATWVLQTDSGGSTVVDAIAVFLVLDDTSTRYEVRFRHDHSTGQIAVYDVAAAANLGTITVTPMKTEPVQFLVAMDSGEISVWTRTWATTDDRSWTLQIDAATVASAASSSTHEVRWGHVTSTTAQSQWMFFAWAWDEYVGRTGANHLSNGQTNPDDLFSRALTARSGGMYLGDGVKLRGAGSARKGEKFYIDAYSNTGAQKVFADVSLSPRVPFKSSSTAAQTISVNLDTTLIGASVADSNPGNDLVGFYLGGLNGLTYTIKGYNTSGASWDTIASVDTSTGMDSLGYTRYGNVVVGTTGTTDAPWFNAGELVGMTFKLSATVFRRIVWNTEGKWGGNPLAATRQCEIMLQDVAAADPGSGTGAVMSTSVFVAVNLLGVNYAGYQLVIASQNNADGFHTVGAFWPMVGVPLAVPYSNGFVIEHEPALEIHDPEDRVLSVRVPAPPRRLVRVDWSGSPSYAAGYRGTDPTPDFIKTSTSTGAVPTAGAFSTIRAVGGVLRRLAGKATVLLPRYLKATTGALDVQQFTRLETHIPLLWEAGPRYEHTFGDELSDELERLAAISGREII